MAHDLVCQFVEVSNLHYLGRTPQFINVELKLAFETQKPVPIKQISLMTRNVLTFFNM